MLVILKFFLTEDSPLFVRLEKKINEKSHQNDAPKSIITEDTTDSNNNCDDDTDKCPLGSFVDEERSLSVKEDSSSLTLTDNNINNTSNQEGVSLSYPNVVENVQDFRTCNKSDEKESEFIENHAALDMVLTESMIESFCENHLNDIEERLQEPKLSETFTIDPFHLNVTLDDSDANLPHANAGLPDADNIINNVTEMDKQKKLKITNIEILNQPIYRIYNKMEETVATDNNEFVEANKLFSASVTANENENLNCDFLHSTLCESESQLLLVGDDDSFQSRLDNDQDRDSDEDYNPSNDEPQDSFSDEIIENIECDLKEPEQTPAPIQLNASVSDHPQASAPDDEELRVDTASTGSKKHFCFYCHKFQAKLARHLELVHNNEEDVKKFIRLPPKNKERQEIIATIRKNGDYLFNTEKRFNTGSLIVCRRPNIRLAKTAKDFLICGNCKGQYSRSVIRHHFRKCANYNSKKQRMVSVNGKKIAARIHEKASIDVRKYVFPYMKEDAPVRAIRYDELVILYANKLCERHGMQPHLYEMIRAKLRRIGRFLLAIKSINEKIKNFSDVFQPRCYDAAISAVRLVAGFDREKKLFAHPAVASALGTLLKDTGKLLRSEVIKEEEVERQKKVEDFLKLLDEDFGVSINRAVTETQSRNYRRKEVVLPSNADIKKLHTFLKNERSKYFIDLATGYSYKAWENLSKTTLLSLQIYNRRRPGETERLDLDDYRNHRSIDCTANKEAYDALSEEGKKLARTYVRVVIRGKLNRSVLILIDNELMACLHLIIEYRETAGVPVTNNFVFGLPSQDKDRNRYLRSCELMREYSRLCGAEIPSTLRATQLRKHIATSCVALNLSEGQVTELANFLGHHKDIHKMIYRQPVVQTDIVEMSKLLNTVQGLGLPERKIQKQSLTAKVLAKKIPSGEILLMKQVRAELIQVMKMVL